MLTGALLLAAPPPTATPGQRPIVLLPCSCPRVFAVGLGAIFLLGRPVIEARLETTRQQVEDIRRHGDFGARQQLYADTWHMARDKLWFGWGLGSYATVFGIYNSQYAVEPWFGQTFYAQAHSDWLQSVAEVGLTGTGLLRCYGLLPLAAVFRHRALARAAAVVALRMRPDRALRLG